MHQFNIMLVPSVAIALLAVSVEPASAQLSGIGDKLKKKGERKADQKVDQAMNDAVDCMFGDKECIERAEKDGKKVVIVDKAGKPMPDEAVAAASGGAVGGAGGNSGSEVWRNYDFVPGKTVVYASDFSDERIGRVPADFELVRGNMQLVERDGVRMLEFSGNTVFRIPLKQKLAPGVSVEFDAQTGAPNLAIDMYFSPLATSVAKYPSDYASVWQRAGIYRKGTAVSAASGLWDISKRMHAVRFQYDGDYALLYIEHERAGNVPKANFEFTNAIEFHVAANPRGLAYLTNFVVAVGLDDLYSALKDKGEFTTRGIYFATASHEIRPESTPTLEKIQETLAKHPELAVTIEGHTDDRGEEKYNRELSERRARAVVDYLVASGIKTERLKSTGLGEGKPVADNGTAAGRQENRRVVIRRDP